MRRSIVAAVVCIALIGVGALAAAAAEPQSDPGRNLVSIHVREAPIQDVIDTVMTASGASIVLADVAGTITINRDNVPVERILEIICQAKGCYWWRDDAGIYYMSAKPRPAASGQAAGLPGLAEPAGRQKVSRMYHLQFLPPQYLTWLFGASDDPGPMPYSSESLGASSDIGAALMAGGSGSWASRGTGELAAVGGRGAGGGYGGGARAGGGRAGGGVGGGLGRGGRAGGRAGGGIGGGFGGGGGVGGAGTFAALTPPGIDLMVAIAPLNALLIHGTEEDINELIDILKMLDRKPQQIIVELQEVEVSNSYNKQRGLDWFYVAGNTRITPQGMGTPASIVVSYTPPGVTNFSATLTYLLETGRGRITSATRVATMNLLPAWNSVVVDYPWATVGGIAGDPFRGTNISTLSVTTYSIGTTLYITPRINGDGTITMYVPWSKSQITGTVQLPTDAGTIEYPITTTNDLVTTVNVRDGETFVLGGFIDKSVLESERRLPLLGDLPIIGDLLFTREVRTISDSETLVFVTPRIVKEEAAPATLAPI
jgi:type II secretory pathway component GspD/PulD (secretin)